MRTIWCVLLLVCAQLFAADTYSTMGSGNGYQEITVTTAATVTVTISSARYTIVHLNIQNDGSTASVAGDAVFIQPKCDVQGAAITIDPTHADGAKLPLLAGAVTTINGNEVPPNADGTRTIQLKALTHGAKLLIKRE